MPPRFIDEKERQAREDEILDQALALIDEQGIAYLTIDKLVSRVSYSKGTIYNHFSSKEDVLTALCNRNMQFVAELFSRTLTLDVSARKKMVAICFGYMTSVIIRPQYFSLKVNVKTEIFDKASDERKAEHEVIDKKLFGTVLAVINEAIDNGELTLAPGMGVEQVAFAFWSMSYGTISLMFNGLNKCHDNIGDLKLEEQLLAHGTLVMNGLGWKDDGSNNEPFIQFLKENTYAEEAKQAGLKV